MKVYKRASNTFVVRFPSTKDRLQRHREKIESFRKEHSAKSSFFDTLSDDVTAASGSTPFLIFHVIFFIFWLALNNHMVPGFEPFDPFPFGLLTTIVSLEAIFLSIFVLLSQNRQSKIAELREEMHLHINMIAEKEITKLIQMQAITMKRLGIEIKGDEDLEKMMQEIDTNYIKKQLEKEVDSQTTMIGEVVSDSQKSVSKVLKKLSSILH